MWDQKEQYEKQDVVEKYKTFTGLRSYEKIFIEKYFKADDFILDIGCGAGRTTLGLIEQNFKVVGIDYSSLFMSALRESKPDAYWLQMDATALAFADASFNVTMFPYNGVDCILPFAARLNVFREMSRVTKPGGYVIFSSRPILNRIFNRFRKKRFTSAAKDNLKDVIYNIRHNLPHCLHGYNLHRTEFEWVNLYMSTTRKIKKQLENLKINLELVDLIGVKPGMTEKEMNYQSHLIYFVYQKNE